MRFLGKFLFGLVVLFLNKHIIYHCAVTNWKLVSKGIDEEYLNTLKTSGNHKYNHFFPISKENDCLELKFKVKTNRDAHVLLSPKLFPESGSPVYEIVLGAGQNTYSDIRRQILGDTKITQKLSTILVSAYEWREFWIKIEGKKIQVGRKHGHTLMEWEDPHPLSIKYFSFSGYDNTVRWIFPVFKDGDFWF